MHQVFNCFSRRRLLLVGLAGAVVSAATPIARAQEVALPEASPSQAPTVSPAPAAAPTAAPTIPPPQLIPPDILPMPDPSAPPVPTPPGATLQELDEALKPKSISQAAENYRLHIEWRKLRNVAQNNPRVKEALAATQHARNDLEKRHLLAAYFNVLFDTEIALGGPVMKDYLNDRRKEFMSALPQPRVRPTGSPGEVPKRKRDAAIATGPSPTGATATPALGVPGSGTSPSPTPSPAVP